MWCSEWQVISWGKAREGWAGTALGSWQCAETGWQLPSTSYLPNNSCSHPIPASGSGSLCAWPGPFSAKPRSSFWMKQQQL